LPLMPWLGLAGASGLLTAWVERRFIGAEGPGFSLDSFHRCLLAGRVIWFYLAKLFWPANLMFIYPRWNVPATTGRGLLCFVAAIGLTAFLWLLRRRSRGPLAAWLFFAGSLFPALGFLNVYPFIFSYVADHFQYLASLGIIALAAAGIDRWQEPRRAAIGAVRRRIPIPEAILLLLLAVLTWRQCLIYRDAETLYAATLRSNPDAWLAHLNLGNIDLEKGRTAEAIDHYRRAETLEPDYPSIHFNLAKIWLQEGRLAESIAENREDLRLIPTDAEARNNIGIALAELGRTAEAEVQFREALRLRPDYPRARANLEELRRMSGAPRP